MNATAIERRTISLFKVFIEKVFVPFLPKMDMAAQKEWNQFSKIINADSFSYTEANVYVETLALPNQGISPTLFDRNRNKSPINITNQRK